MYKLRDFVKKRLYLETRMIMKDITDTEKLYEIIIARASIQRNYDAYLIMPLIK